MHPIRTRPSMRQPWTDVNCDSVRGSSPTCRRAGVPGDTCHNAVRPSARGTSTSDDGLVRSDYGDLVPARPSQAIRIRVAVSVNYGHHLVRPMTPDTPFDPTLRPHRRPSIELRQRARLQASTTSTRTPMSSTSSRRGRGSRTTHRGHLLLPGTFSLDVPVADTLPGNIANRDASRASR